MLPLLVLHLQQGIHRCVHALLAPLDVGAHDSLEVFVKVFAELAADLLDRLAQVTVFLAAVFRLKPFVF